MNITLSGNNYSNVVSNNSTIITIPSADLSNLVDETDYKILANIEDLAGNPITRESKVFTVMKTHPNMTITSADLSSGDTKKNEFITLKFTSTKNFQHDEILSGSFIESDITVVNGYLSQFGLDSSESSKAIYSAIFTPDTIPADKQNLECSIIVSANKYTDIAENGNIEF